MQNLERETQSLKEVTNQYQYDTYNYDYSSNPSQSDGAYAPEADHAAIPSLEGASATQGAELPPAETHEQAMAHEPEIVAQANPESGQPVEHTLHSASHESAVEPAEHQA